MLSARRLVITALVLLAAVPAHATEEPSAPNPEPASVTGLLGDAISSGAPGSQVLAADPAAGIPDIPANQAEIEALRAGAMTLERPLAADAAAPVDADLVSRRAAFDEVISAQQQKIAALTDRLAAAAGNEEAMEIQKEIGREKESTQRKLLDLQLVFALRDGDQARVDQLQDALAAPDAPRPALQQVDRPVPAKPVR